MTCLRDATSSVEELIRCTAGLTAQLEVQQLAARMFSCSWLTSAVAAAGLTLNWRCREAAWSEGGSAMAFLSRELHVPYAMTWQVYEPHAPGHAGRSEVSEAARRLLDEQGGMQAASAGPRVSDQQATRSAERTAEQALQQVSPRKLPLLVCIAGAQPGAAQSSSTLTACNLMGAPAARVHAHI